MKSKIIDNPTTKEILDHMKGFEALETLYKAIPFAKMMFPKLEDAFSRLPELKGQVSVLYIPDKFNDLFAQHGWIAYESFKFDVMKHAIDLYEKVGLAKAEEYITTYYDEEVLNFGIMRCNGHPEFRRRIRLIKLAKEDYLSGRYHACIPLLLSLLDGIVNDVTKHVGLFAENVDMTAWDCIAAHESGLQALSGILTKGRNKTNERPLSVPYRNGILHGRELAFDNNIVAAKCWAALFAVRDWAAALDEGKKNPKPKEKVNWKKVVAQLLENGRQKKALKEWKPRSMEECPHLPFSGNVSQLPEHSPERTIGEFLESWKHKRYGPMADALLDFTDTPKGTRAGLARQDFGRHTPNSFRIVDVEDQAAAVSHVTVELFFRNDNKVVMKKVSVRAVYLDTNNNPVIRPSTDGTWRINQNSFSDIIYAH